MIIVTAPIRTLDDLRGRRVVVFGLARSGCAAARMLADRGAEVTVYDRRPAGELRDEIASLGDRAINLALAVSEDEAHALIAAGDLLVTSPSISPDFPTTDPWLRKALRDAIERGVELVSEVELFLRLTSARVLAVTGTKGKTTTSALIGEILAESGISHLVGGNIGRPLIEEVGRLGPGDWVVLELSELQLPTISRGADVAVYTNIGADHLDRHASLAAYRAVKARLGELSARSGRVVLNADDPGCRDLGARLPAAAITWYGLTAAPWLVARITDGWLTIRGERVIPVAELPLPGRHLLADVLAAALAADLAGASSAAIAAGIRKFRGVSHRLETLGEWRGIRWVNDSQATIPMAAIAALEALAPARVVLIAGGQDKGLDYVAFAEAAVSRCRAVVLIGETADQLDRLIAGRVTIKRAASMDDAVRAAARLAVPGDVVLLSPATASFDMFTDYAARGDAFRAAASTFGGAPSQAEPDA